MSIIEDVVVILGRDLTDAENNRADRLADLAEGLIEGALPGFTITPGTETVTVEPNADELWTPRYPVTALNSVTIDGQPITDTLDWNEKGRIRPASTILDAWELNLNPLTVSTVEVDYDYGFDDNPDDVNAVVAGMVASVLRRQAANPDGLASTTLGAYSESHFQAEVQALAQGMTVPAGALNRWKRNRQVSVPLYR